MRVSHFDHAVASIYTKDSRIEKEAYYLLRDALDFTCDQAQERGDENMHVSAVQLLEGFRSYVLKQFGPMAATLLKEWNVSKCEDIGEMVFNLIEEGIFSRQDSDEKSDFKEIFNFQEAFVHPFLPKTKIPAAK